MPTRSLSRYSAALLAALAIVLLDGGAARASGLYFPDRGVRPLGRGGAFTAGGDDLGSIAYNIAGMYDAGSQLFLDASWVNFNSEFTRQTVVRQVDPNTGEQVGEFLQTYPTVNGSTPFLAIPTIGVSFQPHPQWVLGGGIWAPYAALPSYPE